MTVRDMLKAAVRRRPYTAWWAYLPIVLVVSWFAAMGCAEEGIRAAWPYLLLLLLCLIQCVYATVLGWTFLFIPCVVYAVAVAVTPHNGTLTDYLVFFLCGAVPATFLFFVRPSRKKRTTEPLI
jgi:hypothetical protein